MVVIVDYYSSVAFA